MGKLEGKVALITGAARGQGRSHAVRLAQEGADIIAADICQPIDSAGYPMATLEDLAQTVKEVEALDRRIVATQVDVRDSAALRGAVEQGVAELGGLDIVLANAGIHGLGSPEPEQDKLFRDIIEVNLTGVWNTVSVTAPIMIEQARGGSIVLTSSTQGLTGRGGDGSGAMTGYSAAKHGVVGLMRSFSHWLAPHRIRVNSVHPTLVNTIMIQNEQVWGLFDPSNPHPTRESAAPIFQSLNALPVPWVEPVDISNAVLFLASDEARYITGVTLPVDAGAFIK